MRAILLTHLAFLTACGPGEVAAWDVVVVGSGPAGLAAAWEAREAGAEVVILEMEDHAGGGGLHAGFLFAAGTSWQRDLGIEDSPEAALAEWADFTHGGDPDDPAVVDLVDHSGSTVQWLVDHLDVEMSAVVHDPGAGTVARVHAVGGGVTGATGALVEALEEHLRLGVRVEGLEVEDGVVTGVRARHLEDEEEEVISARAVVMATGGYARDPERHAADRPDSAGLPLAPENVHSAWGAGHAPLEEVGAAWQNPGRHGDYVHSVADYRPGFEGEALWLPHLTRALIVDVDGRRVGSEHEIKGFQLAQVLLDAPEQRLVALFDEHTFRGMPVMVPSYNWASLGTPESLESQALLDAGAAHRLEGTAAVEAACGVDAAALEDTVARYESFLDGGEDLDFGKPLEDVQRYRGLFYAVELVLGPAKAFGGVDTDASARVVAEDGSPLVGLYAAGEVEGILGSPGVGEGFAGSLTAVYHHGRVAGREAAAHALE